MQLICILSTIAVRVAFVVGHKIAGAFKPSVTDFTAVVNVLRFSTVIMRYCITALNVIDSACHRQVTLVKHLIY